MKQKNYDDIYNQIQNETRVDLPESLQPAAIADLVKNREPAPRKRHTAQFVSVAAAVVLLLAGVVGWRAATDRPKVTVPEVPTNTIALDADDEYLRSPTDYGEIERYFAEKQQDLKKEYRDFGKKEALIYEGAGVDINGGMPEEAVGTGSALTNNTAQKGTHGETNTQVEGVDEADVLKNDGKFLYLVNDSKPCIEILDIRDPQKIIPVSKIALSVAEGEDISFSEIYVENDTLTVVYSIYGTGDDADITNGARKMLYCGLETRTAAAVYDIADRTAPKLIKSYVVDGSYLSSRIQGGKLLLITNYNVPIYKNDEDLKNACVPCAYADDTKTRFAVQDVKLPAEVNDTSYLTVNVINTKNPDAPVQSKAVLGGGENIYCGKDTLLVACTDWVTSAKEETTSKEVNDVARMEIGNASTRLFAFSLSDTICYKGSASVQGRVLNQFSMDAHNGYYRIATTTDEKGSCITVLNENLETVSELSGLAKGEQIYAARFMGDTAYLVTFYQTDPLFVVDLKDPHAPRLAGELKIPGFSNYLHPYSENLLIGVGQDGDENGSVNRLKISLFDVSDKENPKEISKMVYGNAPTYTQSTAQRDHKAFLTLDDGEFAVPVEGGTYGPGNTYASVLTVENNELKITGTFVPEVVQTSKDSFVLTNGVISRITYSGDTLYTLSDGVLTAFSRASGEVLCNYAFYTQEATK